MLFDHICAPSWTNEGKSECSEIFIIFIVLIGLFQPLAKIGFIASKVLGVVLLNSHVLDRSVSLWLIGEVAHGLKQAIQAPVLFCIQ